MKQNPTFEKQFDFDVPVFMWDQHFTPETWGRLKDRNVPYGWRDVPYPVIASTVQLLSESVHSQLVDETKFLNCCICCAVVGNGGILNGSRQGKKIDAHDFVFRLNGAVTKGFEEDVGTKTSFYGFTVNTMKNSLVAYAEYGFTQIPQGKVQTRLHPTFQLQMDYQVYKLCGQLLEDLKTFILCTAYKRTFGTFHALEIGTVFFQLAVVHIDGKELVTMSGVYSVPRFRVILPVPADLRAEQSETEKVESCTSYCCPHN